MKRKLLLFVFLIAMTGYISAQVVADFEVIPLNVMYGGSEDLSTMTVAVNPDQTGINTSTYCVKFVRDKDGVPWGGFWSSLPAAVDVTVNKYVHVKVWKTRITPIKFKLEGGSAGTLEIASMNAQTTVNAWEDIVFDFSEKTGTYPIIAFMPDFEDPITLTEDIIIYFDDIMVNNDPTPNTAAGYVIEDCEAIPLNMMLGGEEDLSNMTIVPNPDPSGINTSGYVVQFNRDMDGVSWGGFWSSLPTPVDVTTNKYVHVKVWKPRVSPIKFKLEGGEAGTLEVASTNTQTMTGAWQDFVFDFSSKTGTYPIIAFMPDFADPVGLTEDIVIYFDDIQVTDSPVPISLGVPVTLNVDMHGSGLAVDEPVYLAGDFGGAYGTWNEPGTNPANQLTDPDADSVYSLTMDLLPGTYQFKFFKSAGWNGGEWGGDPNRKVTISGEASLTYHWAVKPAVLTLNVDMHGSGLVADEPVWVAGDFGFVYGVWNEPGTNLANQLFDEDADSVYTLALNLESGMNVAFKFFKGNGWTGGEWDGDPNRTAAIVNDTTVTVFWGVKPGTEGVGDHPLASKVSVYPVPCNTYLTINTSIQMKSVTVSSTMGKKLISIEKPALGTTTIRTEELATGLYFVTFYPQSGNPYTVKVLKY